MKQKIAILLFMLAAACGKQSGEGVPTLGAPAPIPAPITEQQQAGEQQGAVQIVPNILFEGATEFNDDQPQLFQARILDLQNLLPPFEVLIESSNLNILAITIVGSDSPTAEINPNDRRLIRINDVIPTPFAIRFFATPSRVIDRTAVELTLRVIDSQTATVFFNTPPFPITVVPAPIVAEPEPAPVVMEGIISTIAGNGIEGFNGDGNHATENSLAFPKKVAVNNFIKSGLLDGAASGLLVADTTNHRVRQLSNQIIDWSIGTVAGSGVPQLFGGDGLVATAAPLSTPSGVAVDLAGNIFIADTFNHRIRKVDNPAP